MGANIESQGNTSIGGDVVGRDKITYAAPPLTVTALHQLPQPPRDFTGREAELTELLTNFDKGVTISGLHGQGGIGKTALALKLAEQLSPRYPDAQFFLDLKGVSPQPLTTAEALAHVIRAYHPLAKLPEGEAELRGLYLSVLHDQRALLLMDNAKDAAQVELLLPPATCCLLVTSRKHFTLPGLPSKNLEQLPPDDARKLLVKIAPRLSPSPIGGFSDGGGREGVDQIAKLCGYLPLALRLTASALAERVDLSPADLIRRLTDTQQRLKLTGAEASLQLSYDLLTPELQKLWRALAVFPDSFDRAAAAAVWELESDKAHDALSELVKLSMLEYAPHPAPLPDGERESLDGESPSPSGRGDRGEGEPRGRYRLHDLARLYAASLLRASERDAAHASQRHAAHYVTVLRAADELYEQGGEAIQRGLALFDLEQKNIEAGQAWAEKHANENKRALELCDDYSTWGYMILPLRQHPRQQIVWLEIAMKAAQRLGRRQAEGWHLGNLGNAYADLGETRKAIEYYEQRLVIAQEIGDRRGEGAALGNLGIAYAALGETRKAIEFYEQHVTIAREIGDRRGEGVALGNLGNAYADLGEPRKAIEFYEQQLVITREIGYRRGEGNALFNMSLALDKLGERAQAIAHAQAALKIYEQIESPNVGKVRKKLEEWSKQSGKKWWHFWK